MKNVGFQKRRRRLREDLEAAWRASRMTPEDPGLRETYHLLPRCPLHIVGLALENDPNHGGVLRIAEAFRAAQVTFEPDPHGQMDIAGAMGSGTWQPHAIADPAQTLQTHRDAGHTIYALTLREDATPVHDTPWQFPATLVYGEERAGLRPEILALCHRAVAVPMFGLITSLNVTQALTLAVYAATLAYHHQNPDFQPARNASRHLLHPTK